MGPRELQPSPGRYSGEGDAAEAAHLKDLLEEIDRTEGPGPGETERLLPPAARGDAAAAERLLKLNLEMVMRLAAARSDQGLSLGDLFQEGSLGLLEAIRTFDPGAGVEFTTSAERHVGAAMDSALAAAEAARLEDERVIQAAEDFQRVELILARELKRLPTRPELAEKLEWTLERAELVGELVAEARRRHDEEILDYLDPDTDAEDFFFRNGNGDASARGLSDDS
jgi:RNA polymerase primary sigma factor